jgi:glycosyltransferase involved in cell wall biosynthesis
MKTVMVLAVKFPPTGGVGTIRTVKFVKYLPVFGWRPIVVTPKNDTKSIEDDSLFNEIPKKTLVHRPYFFDYRAHFPKIISKLLRPIDKRIFFPDKYLQWNNTAFTYISQKIIPKKKIDLIYTSVGPFSTMLLAHTLKKKFQIPIFINFRDAFSFYQYAILDRKKTYQKKARKIEKEVFKDADHINVVTEMIKKKYEKFYPFISSKSSLIHNGYDEEDFVDMGQKMKNDIFTIGYNGTFSRIVPIKPLITAIIKIHQHHGIPMRLSIATPIKKNTLEAHYTYLFQNNLIDYKGFIPHKNSLKHIYQSDISVLILSDIDATEGIIPAKTFEYLRVANPILLLHQRDGHLAEIVNKTESGIAVNISDHAEIVQSLLMLHQQWRQNILNHQPNWTEIRTYEYKFLTQKLAHIFNQLVD